MKLEVIVHEAEVGGYRAEVPAIPGVACPAAPAAQTTDERP